MKHHPNGHLDHDTLSVRERFAALFMAAMLRDYLTQNNTTRMEDMFTLQDAADAACDAAETLIRTLARAEEP